MPTLAEQILAAPDAMERHAVMIDAPLERVWAAFQRPDMPDLTPLAEEPEREAGACAG